MKTTTIFAVVALLFTATSNLKADVQNGLSVTAVRKTSDRLSGRGSYYYDTTKLTQDLKVDIKNTGIKAYPAGELQWTVLIHSRYYSSSMVKYKGADPVKALRAGEAVELSVGGFESESVRTYSGTMKDKIEYQLIIVHEGKETYRFQTTPSFDAIAKKASMAQRDGESRSSGTTTPTRAPEPEKKPTPAPVVVRPTTPPVVPTTPRAPTAPTTPAAPTAPTTPAEPGKKPVDFFYIDGK